MEGLVLIAGLLFSFCAIALTIVLFYKPKPSAPLVKDSKHIEETDEVLSYANKWKRWIPRFEKTHPDLQILFDKTPLEHGVFLESRLTKEKESIVYIFHSEAYLSLFLQALEELHGNYELSVLSEDILVTDREDGKVEQEVVDLLRKKGKRYAFCLMDTSGIVRKENTLFGCIGVKRKCLMRLTTTDANELHYYENVTLDKKVKKFLPWRLRTQLCIPHYQKGMENLSLFFPSVWFTSYLYVRNGEVTISARDEETAEKLLGWYRKKSLASLVLKKEQPSSSLASKEVVALLEEAVIESFENVIPLAVMQEDEISLCLDPFVHSKIAFVPAGPLEVSHQAAVQFYRNIQLKKGRVHD